jgi:DivIVA domain-containing protein
MRRQAEPVTAAEVRAVGFQVTKFREGYDKDQVDAFMTRAVEALEAKESGRTWTHIVTADAILKEKFQATKFREGYDQDQVDLLLDRVVASLRSDGAAGSTASTVTSFGPPVAPPRAKLHLLVLVLVAFMIGMVIYAVVSAG